MVAYVQPLGRRNYQKSSTKGAGGDARTWRGGKYVSMGLSEPLLQRWTPPWRSTAFTLCSCIQNFPSLCKKPLLMPYLLKEPHSSLSHSLFIISSVFLFPPYGLVITLWVFIYLYRTWLKTLGCERDKNQALHNTSGLLCDTYSQNISHPFTVGYLLHLNKWFCNIK